MTHQLELPYQVYDKLQEAAKREGVSPADWINARLSDSSWKQPSREALARYIGSLDSSQEMPNPKYRTEFGEIIAEKFRKQGLDIP